MSGDNFDLLVFGEDEFSAGPTVTPLLIAPSHPGSRVSVAMKNVWVYLAEFDPVSGARTRLDKLTLHGGKLCKRGTSTPLPLEVGRRVWLYCSHRGDLDREEIRGAFTLDRGGFPMVGPLTIPDGLDPELFVDLWSQNDWCAVHNVPVDGVAADAVLMADWNERYVNGKRGVTLEGRRPGFWNYTDQAEKDAQEVWDGDLLPIPLVEFSAVDNAPYLVGTLSRLPVKKCKLLLVHGRGEARVVAGSFNEIRPIGRNRRFSAHHTYAAGMVRVLQAMTPRPRHEEDLVIDAFPEPPKRALLPGDACWQDQSLAKDEMYCGTYSFSTAMNYWQPYTYNPRARDGKYMSDNDIVGGFRNGASKPKHIVAACKKHDMHGVDRSAEYLSRARAMKLLKLWIQAGVPVVVLVNENPGSKFIKAMKGGHYKTLVGYDGDRMFFNNTGMDYEVIRKHRDPGIDYESTPIGNDVDSEDTFWEKWAGYSKLLDFFSDADKCTFIPIYPEARRFAGRRRR